MRLGFIAWLPADAPGERIGMVPPAGTAHDEELRHFLVIQIFLNSGVWRRTKRRTNEQHLIFFDELTDHLWSLRWIVGIIGGDEFDLAAVDTTFRVDLLEVGCNRLTQKRQSGRRRPRIWGVVADANLNIVGAFVIFGLRLGVACNHTGHRSNDCCHNVTAANEHNASFNRPQRAEPLRVSSDLLASDSHPEARWRRRLPSRLSPPLHGSPNERIRLQPGASQAMPLLERKADSQIPRISAPGESVTGDKKGTQPYGELVTK